MVRATFLGGDTDWLAEANGVRLKGRSFSDSEQGRYVREAVDHPVRLRIAVVQSLPTTP
jgi:hypothetical protein